MIPEMPASTDPEAYLLYLDFEEGRVGRDRIQEWVDRRILEVERVEGPLLELTSLTPLGDVAVLRLLEALSCVQGRPDAAMRLVCDLFLAGRLDLRRALNAALRTSGAHSDALEDLLTRADCVPEGQEAGEELERGFTSLARRVTQVDRG
ncbi:MAG: hypothetical protein SangKO_036930 [Sandaracinaceae bacterium]